MGIKQPTLFEIENRGIDIKLSTLKRYVETMGGKLRMMLSCQQVSTLV